MLLRTDKAVDAQRVHLVAKMCDADVSIRPPSNVH